jgi:hypothetical protein
MSQFNDDFLNNLSKENVFFYQYFNELQGKTIRIDYLINEIYIMGEDQSHCGTVRIAKSAKEAGLELSKLLNPNPKIGEYMYMVLLNGFDNKDWLFAVNVFASI